MRKVIWLIVGAVSAIQVSNAATIAFINTTGNVNFNYSLTVPGGDQLGTGDFFTIFDFGMFVSATPPANFTASTALVAPNSPGANNPALPDVTFTYTGTAVLGPQTFTGFVIAALAGTTQTTDDYFAQSHNPATQQVRSTTGTTTVGAAGPALVPEPATLGLASLGFVVLALTRRRRGCTGSEPRQ